MYFEEINNTLSRLADDAMKGCGLSHDLYVKRFSTAVDNEFYKMAPAERSQIYELAKDFDYATVDERNETDAWNRENGYCSHGIELGCCPAGCE
jgi:hypothetical protein